MAAGMTMDIDNVEALRDGLNEWMARLNETTSLEPSKKIDVLLEPLMN
jgi:single-stranded-DNA-specific exonuclease